MSSSQQVSFIEPESPSQRFDSKADFTKHVEGKFEEISYKPEANFSYVAEASEVLTDQKALEKVQHF